MCFLILSYCRHEQQLGHVLQSWRQEGLVQILAWVTEQLDTCFISQYFKLKPEYFSVLISVALDKCFTQDVEWKAINHPAERISLPLIRKYFSRVCQLVRQPVCFVGGSYWLEIVCFLFVFVEKQQYFGGSSWKSQIKDVHTIHCTIQFLTD